MLDKLTVAALKLRDFAGVTKVRIDLPLEAMTKKYPVQVISGVGNVQIPSNCAPGIFILHRQIYTNPGLVSAVESLINKGWVVVSDIDDDPGHWPDIVKSGFYAYKAVHAVTTSTPRLAELLSQINPYIKVIANGVTDCVDILNQWPKSEKIKIFVGALNREPEFREISEQLTTFSANYNDRIHWNIIGDHALYETIPNIASKSFFPVLEYDKYKKLLAESDLSLLPLKDNQFNHMKSDLKFIESLAAGVLPVCSDVVYADNPELREYGLYVSEYGSWLNALINAVDHPEIVLNKVNKGLKYTKDKRKFSTLVDDRYYYYQSLLSNWAMLESARRNRLA